MLSSMFIPIATYAAGGLVPCDGADCHFGSILTLVHNGVNFLILLILPICAIVIAYAGFLFLTSGGSTETLTKAKGVFIKAVIGIILILAAWLIVNTILATLGLHNGYSLLKS